MEANMVNKIIEKRQSAVDFLNNANTQWRYLIGSYHKDSFTLKTNTTYTLTWQEKYGFLGKWYPQTKTFGTYADAQNYYAAVQVYNKRNNNISSNSTTEKIQSFFPSDGVILVKSQKAYPGVKTSDTYHMQHNNHMQVRNSSETKRALEDLYDGVLYDTFFKLR